MRDIHAIIIGAGLVLATIAGVGLFFLLSSGGTTESFGGSSSVDSGARIEIEILRQQMDDMQIRVKNLEEEVSRLQSQPGPRTAFASDPTQVEEILRDGPNTIVDAYAQVVLIANRRGVNRDLRVNRPSELQAKLGRPRQVLTDNCEPMTNKELRSKLVLESVGPIRVNMLKPAAESLRRVFDRVKQVDPDLYDRISTAGSLCVRRIRGTVDRLSTHSYGLAVDLNIDGVLDNFADGKTQMGLTILADFFREEGWVWGAGFGREDSMHFEVSSKMLDRWIAEGKL
jgi:hypothetical protein